MLQNALFQRWHNPLPSHYFLITFHFPCILIFVKMAIRRDSKCFQGWITLCLENILFFLNSPLKQGPSFHALHQQIGVLAVGKRAETSNQIGMVELSAYFMFQGDVF